MTDTDKPTFRDAFSRLAVALQLKDPDVVMMRVYFDALQRFEIEFVVAAAERLMRREWFPKVSEWLDAVEMITRERRAAQRAFLRTLPSPLCADCDDTGWTRTDGNRVRRCSCVELRRLELLGRQPSPTLPSAPNETGGTHE